MDMKKIESILAEYGLTADAVDFDYAEMDEEALRAAAEAFKANVDDNSENVPADEPEQPTEDYSEDVPVDDTAEDVKDTDSQPADDGDDQSEAFVCEFAATYNQRREALQNAVDNGNVVTDQSGTTVETTYYWLVDFDDTYAYVTRYVWRRDGDDTEDRGRLAYSFDEANLSASVTSEFEVMHLMWLTEEERQKLEASRDVFEEYESLKQYKAEREKEERKVKVDELFEQFEDLNEVAGFGDLRSAAYEGGEMADIEDKLYALRGRQMKSFAKTTAPAKTTLRVGIVPTAEDEEPYGGILKKH